MDADNIYYNILVQTNRENPAERVRAQFTETRVQPIIHHPRDFELAIVRFKVPSFEIPLIFFKTNAYTVSLEYDGYVATSTLLFVSGGNADEYKRDTVWNIGQFLESVNTAFKDAYDELKLNKPLITATVGPYMRVENEKFTLYTEDTEYTTAPTPYIKIYMNPNLYYYFTGFECFENVNETDRRHRIIIRNTLINGITIGGNAYLMTDEEYPSISQWSELVNIAFETSSIPINAELLPTQNNSTRYIITDFELIEKAPNATSYQYFPQGPLRFYSLQSQFPLYTLDVRLVWIAKDGTVHDLYISGNIPLTLKLYFSKKEELRFKNQRDIEQMEARKDLLFGKY